MNQSFIGCAFEDLGMKEMAASQGASVSENSINITLPWSITGSCLPNSMQLTCQATTFTITTITA